MKKLTALLIIACICCFCCSCDKLTDWMLEEFAENNRFDINIDFEFENENDIATIEKRLEWFDFKIISKDGGSYQLNCPYWVRNDFFELLCSNGEMNLVNGEGEPAIASSEIISGKCDLISMSMKITEAQYNKCIENETEDYLLTDGVDEHVVLWYTEAEKKDYVIELCLEEFDPETDKFTDGEKAFLYYTMNTAGAPLEGKVSFTFQSKVSYALDN